MQGGYNDASSAAAAAREYYLQAKLASEAAERWAQGHSTLLQYMLVLFDQAPSYDLCMCVSSFIAIAP